MRNIKYSAMLKSDDPVIARREATGYYFYLDEKHYIILDGGAEIYNCDLCGDVLDGFVEIEIETLKLVL